MKLKGFLIMAVGFAIAHQTPEEMGVLGILVGILGLAIVLEGHQRDMIEILKEFEKRIKGK